MDSQFALQMLSHHQWRGSTEKCLSRILSYVVPLTNGLVTATFRPLINSLLNNHAIRLPRQLWRGISVCWKHRDSNCKFVVHSFHILIVSHRRRFPSYLHREGNQEMRQIAYTSLSISQHYHHIDQFQDRKSTFARI